ATWINRAPATGTSLALPQQCRRAVRQEGLGGLLGARARDPKQRALAVVDVGRHAAVDAEERTALRHGDGTLGPERMRIVAEDDVLHAERRRVARADAVVTVVPAARLEQRVVTGNLGVGIALGPAERGLQRGLQR